MQKSKHFDLLSENIYDSYGSKFEWVEICDCHADVDTDTIFWAIPAKTYGLDKYKPVIIVPNVDGYSLFSEDSFYDYDYVFFTIEPESKLLCDESVTLKLSHDLVCKYKRIAEKNSKDLLAFWNCDDINTGEVGSDIFLSGFDVLYPA